MKEHIEYKKGQGLRCKTGLIFNLETRTAQAPRKVPAAGVAGAPGVEGLS
jgi:hypothetical protein